MDSPISRLFEYGLHVAGAVVAALCLAGSAAAATQVQEKPFVPDGAYSGSVRDLLPPGIHTYGSWAGSDEYEGHQDSAWTPATSDRVLYIAGHPVDKGLFLEVQWRLDSGSIVSTTYRGANPGYAWVPWRVKAPSGAAAVRWVAEDHSRAHGGWLAVSDFIPPSGSLREASLTTRAFAAFIVIGMLFGLSLVGIRSCLDRKKAGDNGPGAIPESLWPMAAMAAIAAAGFVILGIWFFSPRTGAWVSCVFVGATAIVGARRIVFQRTRLGWLVPFALAAGAGIFYLAILMRYPTATFHDTAEHRFSGDMPGDNDIPRLFVEKLIRHEKAGDFMGDWRSSDRPPLQSGWFLLYWPLLQRLHIDMDTAAGAAGCWFQLSWCLALWGLAAGFGLSRTRALALVSAVIPVGLVFVNSVYTWPKLAACAFVMAAVTLGILTAPAPGRSVQLRRSIWVGILVALGCLSHGGVAFAVLGAIPLFAWRFRPWRAWAAAGLALFILVAPWLAYQRFYDPPGNRLLKVHLAGVVPVDGRGIVETLFQQYHDLGWRGALKARRANLVQQFAGAWGGLTRFDSSFSRRFQEVSFYIRSCGFYLPAGALGWLAVAFRRRPRSTLRYDAILVCALWVLFSWAAWIALMFTPNSTIAHQGTYTIPLGLYSLLLVPLVAELPVLFTGVIAIQLIFFLATWLPR